MKCYHYSVKCKVDNLSTKILLISQTAIPVGLQFEKGILSFKKINTNLHLLISLILYMESLDIS